MDYALGKKFYKEIIPQFVAAREKLGYTQATVDEILGVARGLVSKWEVGIRKPSGYLFCCWADALKCRVTLTERENDDHVLKEKE